MPLQATSGAASYDAFGGGVAVVPNYIEDVFNTYVWTGTGSDQTLTTGIDTSTYGGLFWTKNRTTTSDHALWSTNFSIASGSYLLKSNTTGALTYGIYGTGDYVSNSTTGVTVYGNPQNYVTWTFREQPKFFDVVTYTGNGGVQNVPHNLGSVPGCIIVKRTGAATDWYVYHRGLAATEFLNLNLTDAVSTNTGMWDSRRPSSTSFPVGASSANGNGSTYVAYVYAHNAGGFGLTGTDNVISCGSFVGTGSPLTVTLGYEPQWLLVKSETNTDQWVLIDNMRGWPATSTGNPILRANTSGDESAASFGFAPYSLTSTGFITDAIVAGRSYIYIAIRRGPMKVPTDGTKVFAPNYFATGTSSPIVTGFPVDMQMYAYPPGAASVNTAIVDRLRGVSTTTTTGGPRIITSGTAAESAAASSRGWSNTGFSTSPSFGPSDAQLYLNFRRAPSFFDEVCYTGTGSARSITHNLGVPPELIITKMRSGGASWMVFSTSSLLYGYPSNGFYLNTTNAMDGYNFVTSAPTATTYSVGTGAEYNSNTSTYVSYLFATCLGVSKIGSYTGTGTTQTINCGFTGGARFVLIKSTSTTGEWYVWDTARGMIPANDPYLRLNSTAAEVTGTDWVDTAATGFELSNAGGNLANSNGVSYIFLAIS